MATQSKTQFLTERPHLAQAALQAQGRSQRLPALGLARRSSTGSATKTRPASTPTRPSRGSTTSSSTGTRSASAVVEEIQESLAGIPDPEQKAQRIRRFLRQLFNRTYGFTLDALAKKPLKEALKILQTYEAFASDYVTATVIQQALGGHAIPIDKRQHAGRSSGWGSPKQSSRPFARSLERAVPKNRGAEFLDLIEDLANDTCVEGEPDCPHCELRKICPFALARKYEVQAAAPAGRSAAARATKGGAVKATKAKEVDHAAAKPVKKKPATRPAKEAPRAAKPSRDKHGRAK